MNEGADKAVRDALDAFFVRLATEDDLWVGMFEEMDATTRNAYRDNFRANPCTVRLGYPRDEEAYPVVSVHLAADQPEKDFAGRSQGLIGQIGTDVVQELWATMLQQQVVCACVGRNIDAVRILAYLTLAGAIQARDALVTAGYSGLNPNGMQDLSPQESGLPLELSARVVSFGVFEHCQFKVPAAHQPLKGPAYVGIQGTDLGHGHVGGVVPVADIGG